MQYAVNYASVAVPFHAQLVEIQLYFIHHNWWGGHADRVAHLCREGHISLICSHRSRVEDHTKILQQSKKLNIIHTVV